MALTETESAAVEKANKAGKGVVFIHGLWLLPSSWDRWGDVFSQATYTPIPVSWPGDPENVEEARKNPEAFANVTVGQVAAHVAEVVAALDEKPAIVGHSFGGLQAQIAAGRGLSKVTVAIDPAPFRGVLALPISTLRAAGPVLANPLNRGKAVTLSLGQFKYGWANALDEKEAAELYEEFHVAGSAKCLFQGADANINPFSELKVDTDNPHRGPLLIISGEKDHTVPWAIANSSFKKQKGNEATTEISELSNRGHSLTIDSGWQEVAETALKFVQRFT